MPFTVKEDIDCLGSATTHGVPRLRDALPYADAPSVARLKRAGAIPIARTNLSEMGLRLCTVNIQIYAGLWREDLCLHGEESLDGVRGPASAIDPVRPA